MFADVVEREGGFQGDVVDGSPEGPEGRNKNFGKGCQSASRQPDQHASEQQLGQNKNGKCQQRLFTGLHET